MHVWGGGGEGGLCTETALDEAKRFFKQGSFEAAHGRFEDVVRGQPGHVQAGAYLAWLAFVAGRYATELRPLTSAALQLALRTAPDAELCYRRALLYRLDDNTREAERLLEQALRLDPAHAAAKSELAALRARRAEPSWAMPAGVDVRATMIVQRRIFNRITDVSFRKPEVRIGSGDGDDLVVSDAVFPFVARRHCTVTARGGGFTLRRTASLGRVWVNGEEIPVRTDVRLRPGAEIHLCSPIERPPVALRVFGLSDLHDLTWQELACATTRP
jgi:hypothetical protein